MKLPFCAACLLLVAACQRAVVRPALSVTTTRKGDKVEIVTAGNQSVLLVTSELGIGQATVKASNGVWPERLVLRFYLGDLEGLTLTNSRIHMSSFLGASGQTLYYAKDNAGRVDRSAPAGHIYLTIVKQPTYIDVIVPALMLQNNTPSFQFEWVDWYR